MPRDINPSLRFKTISTELRNAGMWGFPIYFKRGENGHFDKKPYVKWKEFQERPPTNAEWEKWITEFARASAGIPTGPSTGLLVVDADGVDQIEYIEKRGMYETWIVETLRGLHYYCQFPQGLDIHNSASLIAPGIDIRGIGGFVAAPGSSYMPIVDNQLRCFTYHWHEGHSPGNLPLAPAPAWLLEELVAKTKRAPTASPSPPQAYRGKVRAWARRAYDGNLETLSSAVEGTRNTVLFQVARRLGQLCAGGELEEFEVLASVRSVANSWTNESQQKSYDTIRRAFALGQQSPRSAPPPKPNLRYNSIVPDLVPGDADLDRAFFGIDK